MTSGKAMSPHRAAAIRGRMERRRAYMGLSVDEAAERAGMENSALWAEGEVASMPLTTLVMVCLALECSADWLLFGDEEVAPAEESRSRVDRSPAKRYQIDRDAMWAFLDGEG